MAANLGQVIPRPGRLSYLGEIKAELAKVYRDMRTNRIPMRDGTALAYVLMALARIIEGGDMEERLERLEKSMNTKGVITYEVVKTETERT